MRTWILFGFCASCCGSPLLYGKSDARGHLSLLGDFVYMRRTQIHDHDLVKAHHHTVIDAKDLLNKFEFEPGYRVSLTFMPSDKNSFEAIYLDLQPWHGEKKKHYSDLHFPFSHSGYSHDFTDAETAHAKYKSHFWDAEFNYWRNFTPRNANYFALSGIVGFRYLQLNESFKLSMIRQPNKSSYSIHTDNRMYGLQLGLDFQMNPMRWLSWDFFAKVGFFANDTEQKQFLGDLDNRVTLRHSKKHAWESGFFTDVSAQLGFNFLKYFNLHGGYQMMFLSGLAIAPEQVSNHVGSNAGKEDKTNGTAIIHGLFAGLTISF